MKATDVREDQILQRLNAVDEHGGRLPHEVADDAGTATGYEDEIQVRGLADAGISLFTAS